MNSSVSPLEAALSTLEAVFPEVTLEAIRRCEEGDLSDLHSEIGWVIRQCLGLQPTFNLVTRNYSFDERLDTSTSSFYILRMLQHRLRASQLN